MRKNFMMTLLGLACVVSFGLAALPSRAQEAAPAPEYMDMEAQTAAAGCYDNGGTVDCGDCGTCDSCVGCGGCYGGCGGCYGGCGLGILPFVHDVAAVALTPALFMVCLDATGLSFAPNVAHNRGFRFRNTCLEFQTRSSAILARIIRL